MKDDTETRERYHHGNLPDTLVDEAVKLLAEKGVDGFSMREVARRAGVAVAAPAHHFGNAKGLLTAIATRGFVKLMDCQDGVMAAQTDPVARVAAICRGYVTLVGDHPGYAAVLFRWDLVDGRDAAHSAAASAALDKLISAVAAAAPEGSGETEVRHAAKTLWAAMHGFVNLSLTGKDEDDARIDFAVRTLIAGMGAPSG